MKSNRHILTWKNVHKWIGLVLTVFLLLFCLSGLVLNHRGLFASCSVSRSILPEAYHIRNFNNGIIKGTIPFSADKVLVYGNAGVWLADRKLASISDFNDGLPEGADNRNVRNIVRTSDGTLWCAAQFGLYRLDGGSWTKTALPGNDERIADVTLTPDSAGVVAMTRSAIYRMSGDGFQRQELSPLEGQADKVSLFKTIWHLHSGDLFGITGKIIVDIIAIVIIFLCLTGIVLFVLPYSIRKGAKAKAASKAKTLKWNFRWHNKAGYYTIVLTLLIAVTGACLRPPLMIPFVMVKTAPLPGSTLDSDNAWHDKLRGIRWDATKGNWLISTSDGFIRADRDFTGQPHRVDSKTTPPVSPMGINVFEHAGDGKWLIGSFSGLYVWDPSDGAVTDYFIGAPYTPSRGGRPAVASHLVSGYSSDLACGPAVFDYARGADPRLDMPQVLAEQPMSLWNFALELHVGRCYSPFLGPLSDLFVFLSGIILTIVLISGLIIHNRISRKKRITRKQYKQ